MHDRWEELMVVMIDPKKSSLLRAAPRLMQILRVLVLLKFLGALRGKRHWLTLSAHTVV